MIGKQIRLFIKPYCGWCREAQEWLDQRNVQYETLDVTNNADAYKEMVSLSGQHKAPVMDFNGEVLADFGVDELEVFWKENGLDGGQG